MLPALIASIEDKKAELDRLRSLSWATLRQLQKYYDVELTYASNSIEGNTLTLRETAEVIEHGITVGGKPLRDHLEAVDHYDALLWMREQAAGGSPLGELIVCELHRRIVARSRPDYSRLPRRIAGSAVTFPNPAKIPDLMEQFGAWLSSAPLDPTAILRISA
jgi:Fic family protein